MIRTLQKKFIVTAMTAITALIIVLLGAINVFNIVMVRKGVERTLRILSDNEGNPGNLQNKPEPRPPIPWMGQPKNEHDTFLSSNFFVVRFDNEGNVIFTDLSHISAMKEEEACEMATKVLLEDTVKGKEGKFRYAVCNNRFGNGKTVVYLDTSTEIYSYIRVLLLSIIIGVLGWLLMLLLVALLSKKAIKPIAENIERQKQFVTNAGHEIKTPLAIIQANADALELYKGENKWCKNIKEQTVRLDGLMKNLLTLARMEEHTQVLSAKDISLNQLLSKQIGMFEERMKERGLCLEVDYSSEVTLHADENQMIQFISVLLDNAVKYTNANGKICITLKEYEKGFVLILKNTCDRLPEIAPEKLFERFTRADESRTQKTGGYGIGLSVAKSIVEANHGSINAKYEMPNLISFIVKFHR